MDADIQHIKYLN